MSHRLAPRQLQGVANYRVVHRGCGWCACAPKKNMDNFHMSHQPLPRGDFSGEFGGLKVSGSTLTACTWKPTKAYKDTTLSNYQKLAMISSQGSQCSNHKMSVAFDPFPSLSVQAGGQAKACTEHRGGQTCPERASNESRITNANMSPLLHMHLCSGTSVIYIYINMCNSVWIFIRVCWLEIRYIGTIS